MAHDRFSFKIDFSSRRVIVYFCDDIVQTVRSVMKGVPTDDVETCNAVTFGTNTGNSIVFFDRNPSIDIIVHEVHHISHDVSVPIGIMPSSDTEEYFAYLNQFIFKKIYDRVLKDQKNDQENT